MTVNELIAELEDWKKRNAEPEVPSYDPGTTEVRVESEEGTYDSVIIEITDANGPWVIVKEPDWEGMA
jgi:hypothetical protein